MAEKSIFLLLVYAFKQIILIFQYYIGNLNSDIIGNGIFYVKYWISKLIILPNRISSLVLLPNGVAFLAQAGLKLMIPR